MNQSNGRRPLVSILITTFNRSRLLRRAVESVLKQDFADFELVIIDDCSSDDTGAVVASFSDARIRYLRNDTNVGSKEGDRAILRRFIYELMQGHYFAYLCDDDYWLYPDLLSRQVKAFQTHENVVAVVGGQLSYFLTGPESYFGRPENDTLTVTPENLASFIDPVTLQAKTPHLSVNRGSGGNAPLFAKVCMEAEEFLEDFAFNPTTKNIIGGATLYSRALFLKSGALLTTKGSKWQAGYELKLGPGCFGKTIYFDEPSIVSEIRQSNASFQRTQAEHYLDSIVSTEIAFDRPLSHPDLRSKRAFLRRAKRKTIRGISKAYLIGSLKIASEGELTLCSSENMSEPVTLSHVLPVMARNRMWPGSVVLALGGLLAMEGLTGGKVFRALQMVRRVANRRRLRPAYAVDA